MKKEEEIVLSGENPSKYNLRTEGPKRRLKALMCKRQARQNTEKRDHLFLGFSEVLLKAACWTWKEWHQKQGLSTFNISGNVTAPPQPVQKVAIAPKGVY